MSHPRLGTSSAAKCFCTESFRSIGGNDTQGDMSLSKVLNSFVMSCGLYFDIRLGPTSVHSFYGASNQSSTLELKLSYNF